MANIELKIVALGDFTSVNSQIKALQTQVEALQKSFAGVGLNTNIKSQLQGIQSEFSGALLSSGAFTKQTIQLTSETEKFGKALTSGKLGLGQYFQIITGKSGEAQKAVQALAVEQVKLNNSIVQTDITNKGVYSVYTPTKIDELSKSTEIAAAKQNIYNLAIKNGSEQLINFGKNTQWAGRQLTVGLAVPAMLFGQQAVAAFKSVNTEMTRLQRLYGEGLTPPSQAQLNQISGQVLSLGKQIASTMGIAQSETVKVAANFAAMGIQGQRLLDVTMQAQRLSKLGAIDATQATSTVVALQNVYKVSSQDLGNAVNFLSSMQKQTTMSLMDMTDAIPRVGPIMAQLGGTYKDTAVMLLAMKEAGVPAAQAANALKSAMASIIAPTSAATKEFASFGINLDTIKNAGTPVQMIEALQSSLVRLSPLVKEQLIEKLFGKFQFARVSALLDNFGRVGSQTQNALKVAGATNAQLATLANQEMQQATESQTAKWQRTVETLKADLYPIGQEILKIGTAIGGFAVKVSDFFNKLPGPIKAVAAALALLTVLAGPILMLTGLFANLIGQGIRAGRAFVGLFDGTKKWKDLLTPASVAAQATTDAFEAGMLKDITAVDTLNLSLQKLIANLEAINNSLNASAGSSIVQAVESKAAGIIPIIAAEAERIAPMGMATGGYVPGNPAHGDVQPALLTGGEAVIPTGPAKTYAPFINAMIDGTLPMHARGVGVGSDRIDVTSDAARLSGMGGFGGSAGRGSFLQSSDWSSKISEMQAATKTLRDAGYTEEEISHQLRLTGAHTVAPINVTTPTFNLPYKKKSSNLNDVMPEFEGSNTFASQLSERGGKESSLMSAYKDAIIKGTIKASDFGITQEELIAELDKMKKNVVADTEQHAKIIKSMTDYALSNDLVSEKNKKQALVTSSTLGVRLNTDYYSNSLPTLGNLTPGSAAWDKKQAQIDKAAARGWAQHEAVIDSKHLLQNPELQTPENIAKLRSNTVGIINSSKGGELGSLLTREVLSAREEIKQKEGIASPAKMWEEEVGKPLAQGIGQGFQLELPGITEEMKKSISNIKGEVLVPIKSIGSEIHQELLAAAQQASSVSPQFAEAGIKDGKAFKQAVQTEIDFTSGAWARDGEKIVEQVGAGMNSASAQSKLQGLFNSAFGSGSKLNGLMSKFSGMGMMGRMGVGMGITTAAQMASPLLGSIPGGNLITDAMSGAGMGAGFGPWGMAAGAAIGLVTGGIKSLMNMEKQHAAESKADFSSSADAVQLVGGQVVDTTTKLRAFSSVLINPTTTSIDSTNKSVGVLAKGIVYTTSELSNFETMLKSLPKDNPLSLVAKQIKDTSDSGTATKLAHDFVTMQMAINGISVDQAQKLQQLLLSQGGFNPNSGLAIIPNQISAIKAAIAAALPNASQFSSVLGQLVMAAANSTSLSQYTTYIKGLGEAAGTAEQQLAGLLKYFQALGNSDVVKLITMMQSSGAGFTGQDVAAAVKALQNGQNITFDNLKPGQVASQLSKETNNVDPKRAALLKQQADLQKQLASAQNGTNVAVAANTAAVANNVSGLTKQQKLLDATLKSLQDLQKQTNQATSYATTKEDIKNQILMAQATGDNLKAQLLQQQLLGTTRDYNLQNKVDTAQQAADANRLKLDAANAAVTSAQTTATNTNTTAIDNLNGKISALQTAIDNLPGGQISYSDKSGATSQSALAANTKALNKGDVHANPLLPAAAPKGEKIIYNPLAKHNQQLRGATAVDYTDPTTGYVYEAGTGRVSDKSGKVIGRWAFLNADNVMTAYAKGGVARTNSSITYHRQHMTRQARRFVGGGNVSGPGSATSDSIPAMLSNGEYVIKADSVSHYGTGLFDSLNARRLAKGGVARTNSSITYHRQHMTRQSRRFADGGLVDAIIGGALGGAENKLGSGLDWLSKTVLETIGISPTLRLMQGKKQSSWDYLGATSMLLGPAKAAGLVPKMLAPLVGLTEGADLTQNAMESASNLRTNATSSNHVYNVNVNVAKVDSTVDMTKAINDAMAKVEAKARMSGRITKVGS
jgi:TP901 family phage tail tape measure protein